MVGSISGSAGIGLWEISESRMARLDIAKIARASDALALVGGGTGAWQLGWGQTVYVGSRVS